MRIKYLAIAGAWLGLVAADAPDDLARRFGAREEVSDVSLSPDGSKIAYIVPAPGQGAALFTLALGGDEKSRFVTRATGDPERLLGCNWAANDRLVCTLTGNVAESIGVLAFYRMVAINEDGSNIKPLATPRSGNTRGVDLGAGEVLDWLPDEDGAVLMARNYLPDDITGSRIGSRQEGYAVDRLDTRTLATRRIEQAREDAIDYISDGRGNVRIMALTPRSDATGYDKATITYMYRRPGERNWETLSSYDRLNRAGFYPAAIDHERNLAYGFRRTGGGRRELHAMMLDGSLKEETIFARPDVDVDGLIRIGRRNRVVGTSYATEYRVPYYFDPDLRKLVESLGKALPKQPLVRVIDASIDDSKLLIFASSDDDPGSYFLLDRKTRAMRPLLSKRALLDGVALAKVKPIRYPAADGTQVPGYLTLPAGKESAKGLPAIVLPHGGPSARDEWGFDWLAQFYAARGFAVLQPNFRGSDGYGDAWFQKNGFRSWRVAIGDVLDAGRWLVAQGIADPAKLAVVGWSYGGYAALQSAATDPAVFKAVVAIAPVTDLAALKEEARNFSNYKVVSEFIGAGPHVVEGSPAQNAAKIKVPVLLFHGLLDRNVGIYQSRLMNDRLQAAGVRHELVTWPKLDHYLDDSAARGQMLAKSDAFLRAAMGM